MNTVFTITVSAYNIEGNSKSQHNSDYFIVCTGFDAGGRNAAISCASNHVPLQVTTRTICIQLTRHQPATGCSLVCRLLASTAHWAGHHNSQERRKYKFSSWVPCQESCCSSCSSMVGCKQVLPQHSHQPWSCGYTARGWRSKWTTLCIVGLHSRRHSISRNTGWRWRSLQHPPVWLLCPQHYSANDRTGDSEAICAAAAVTPTTSSSTHSLMASQWISSHQRV